MIKNIVTKWVLFGFFVGMGFLVGSVILDVYIIHISTLDIPLLFQTNELYWVIASAPFVLGIAGFLVGRNKAALLKHTSDVEKKQQSQEIELQVIMDHINNALCIIDRESHIIAINNQVNILFGKREYTGTSLFSNIFYILEEKEKTEWKEFIEVAFANVSATDSMLATIAPFERFMYVHTSEDGMTRHKTIAVSGTRIFNTDGSVRNLMFIFNDRSEEIYLEDEIKRQEKEFNDEYGTLVALLNNDREIVNNFLSTIDEVMEDIAEKLRMLKQNETNEDILQNILSIVHTLKGETFSLGFEEIAYLLKDFESFIKELITEPLNLENNLQLIGDFEKLKNETNKFNKIKQKMVTFIGESTPGKPKMEKSAQLSKYTSVVQASSDATTNTPGKKTIALLKKELALISTTTANELSKKVTLTIISTVDAIPEVEYKLVKDALIHMIRNSISHGIESPDRRRERNKPETGTITIKMDIVDGNLTVHYTDDGAGFDLTKIKEAAIAKNLITEQQALTLDDFNIIKLIFNAGFSTSSETDMVSGVGVGMSVIKDNIMNKLNGKLGIKNKPGNGIYIKMSFPIEVQQ